MGSAAARPDPRSTVRRDSRGSPRGDSRRTSPTGAGSSTRLLLLAVALIAALAASPAVVAQQGGSGGGGEDADASVAPETEALAGLRYRNIGPANMGGRVTDIVGIPGDPDVFWFGGADGGLWMTTDGGTTFEGQWQDAEAYSVGAIGLAPSDHNVLYVGSGEGDPRNSVSYGLGVWRSTDMGRSWEHVGLEGTERIKRIRVHPEDPDTAWVCALGREWGPNEERGVFKTDDGGASWEKVLYVDDDTGCSDLDIDRSNPRVLYAGMWTFRRVPWHFRDGAGETALYRSTDGGDSWEKLDVVDEPMARIGVSVAQSRPATVYAITETPSKGTLFRSDDRGESWRMVNDERSINFRPFYYSDIRVDPTNPEVVWSLSGGLYKSTDGGRNFESVGQGIHGDHQALWIDPENPDHVLSGSDGGHQVTFDGGDDWHIMRNVVLSQYYQIFVDDRDPYYVCGGLQDNGNWCGPSRTNNAGFGGGGILEDEWYTVSGGDGFYTVPVPGKPWLVYSNAQGGYLRITDTRSGVTQSIEPYPRMIGSQGQAMIQAEYRFNWDAPIHVSPHDPSKVYWGGNVLFASTDQGHSWEVISPDLSNDDPEKQQDSGGPIYNDNTAAEFHATILTVRESPLEEGVIWAGTDDGNLWITRDGGENWTKLNDNVPNFPEAAWVAKIDASRHEPDRAYVTVDQHRMDDFTPHVWRCDDYGASCEDLSEGLPQDDYAKVLREDPTNPDLLYVGMERGLYFSWDGGDTWVDMRLNLPPVSVRDIKIQTDYNDLVLGTHGRGAWILDDLSPVQNLAEAMGEDLHVFEPRRATIWQQWDRDSSLGQSTFQGENPPDGAIIDFYLEEVPEEASVKLRITDSAGELVQEVPVEEPRAGVNRATWNLRHSGPTPRQTDRDDEGGFFARFLRGFGAPAVPGTYTATVVVEPGAGNSESESGSSAVVGEGRVGDADLGDSGVSDEGGAEEATESDQSGAGGQRLEASAAVEVRGDPDVEMSAADYRAWHDAAQELVDLSSEVNRMLDRVFTLKRQLESLRDDIDDADLADAEQVREEIDAAVERLGELDDDLERPPPQMGYRQYPRLSEEVRSLMFGVMRTQARPTEGQMTVLSELQSDADAHEAELRAIVDGPIAELNRMLGELPAVVVPSGTQESSRDPESAQSQ